MNQQDPMAEQEYYRQLLQLGNDNAGMDQQIKMQLAQAEALRHGAVPQMREAGRVVKAPGLIELLGGLAQQKVAGDLTRKSANDQATQRANTQQQNMMFLAKLLGGATPPGQTNGAPGTITPGMPPQGQGMQMPQPQKPFSFGGSY